MKFFEKYPMLAIAIGVLGISMSSVLVKYADAPSVVTAAYRLLWTVGLMTPVVLSKAELRREILHTDKKLLALCAVSGVFLALHFTTWFESLSHTSVASSAAIVCTEVVWVALGYLLVLKGKLTGKAVGCILLTLLGSVVIALSDFSGGGNHLSGDFLALAAAVFVGVYTLIGRVARGHMSTTAYTYVVYVFCALSLVLAAAAGGVPLTGYGGGNVVIGLLLCVCSTLLGHSIFSWGLKFFSPAFISASKMCEPVLSAIFALFLFQEIPLPLQIIGGVVTIGGVLLYSREENRMNEASQEKDKL